MKTKTKQKKCPPIFYFRFFFNHFSLSPLPLFRQMMDRAPEAPDTPVSPRRKAALEALKAMRKMKQQQQEQHFLEEGKGGATAIEGRGGGRAAAAAAEEEETAAAAAAAFPRRASSSASSPRLIAAVYPKGRFGEGGRGAEAEEEEEDGGTGGSDGDDGNDSASAAAAEAEAAAAATATLVTAAAASRTQLDWRAQAEALETAKRLFEQQRRTKKKTKRKTKRGLKKKTTHERHDGRIERAQHEHVDAAQGGTTGNGTSVAEAHGRTDGIGARRDPIAGAASVASQRAR